MKPVDFGIMGKYLKIFDTDTMDIYRMIPVKQPNGTMRDELVKVISGIPCHIDFVKQDVPDATSVDVTAAVYVLQIAMDKDIDIRNGDLITAYKLSHEKEILQVYKGTSNEPATVQGRTSILLAIRTLQEYEPPTIPQEPEPEPQYADIDIDYVDLDGEPVADSESVSKLIGETYTANAVTVPDFNVIRSLLDGTEQPSPESVNIPAVNENGHAVVFEYEKPEPAKDPALAFRMHFVDGGKNYLSPVFYALRFEPSTGVNFNLTVTEPRTYNKDFAYLTYLRREMTNVFYTIRTFEPFPQNEDGTYTIKIAEPTSVSSAIKNSTVLN